MTNETNKQVERLRVSVRAEAETWLRTPYHHLARLKGVGVDCVGLLAGVAENSGLVERVDVPAYPMQWHLHNRRSLLREEVAKYCTLVSDETPQTGDIFIFEFGRTYAHSAIVTEFPLCIHASMKAKCVEVIDVERDEHLSRCRRELWRPNALCERGN